MFLWFSIQNLVRARFALGVLVHQLAQCATLELLWVEHVVDTLRLAMGTAPDIVQTPWLVSAGFLDRKLGSAKLLSRWRSTQSRTSGVAAARRERLAPRHHTLVRLAPWLLCEVTYCDTVRNEPRHKAAIREEQLHQLILEHGFAMLGVPNLPREQLVLVDGCWSLRFNDGVVHEFGDVHACDLMLRRKPQRAIAR